MTNTPVPAADPAAAPSVSTPVPAPMQAPAPAADITYSRDIAPILQRSCVTCHNPDGGAPMSLTTFEEVRPYARTIKARTGMGPRAGVMPPWFVEKNIGIQKYKDDPSLSAEEVAKVAKWADSGAPRGNPADMPPVDIRSGATVKEIAEVLGLPEGTIWSRLHLARKRLAEAMRG
mgnify:CR=1 FL=1